MGYDKRDFNGDQRMRTILSRYEDKFTELEEASYIITNSERSAMICPRYWMYEYVQNLDTGEKADALSYGVIVHQFLEMVLKDVQQSGIFPSLDQLNELHRTKLMKIIENEFTEQGICGCKPEMVMAIANNIKRSLKGWRDQWIVLLEKWDIIGVELELLAPIKDTSGNEYRADVKVVKMTSPDGSIYMRPVRQGESLINEGQRDLIFSSEEVKILQEANNVEIIDHNMPFYITGRVDCLLQSKTDPTKLAVLDHKTTGQLWKYEKNAPYDIQLPTYAYLIENGINLGDLDLSNKRVSTVMYDLLHSKVPIPPKPLKSGKFSTRQNCPSWIFEEALNRKGIDHSDYQTVIDELKENDTKYFKIVERDLFDEDTQRIEGELYYISRKMIDHRKAISNVAIADLIGIDGACARQPFHCVMWNNCKFSTNCLNNSIEYVNIEEKPKIYWTSTRTLKLLTTE